jgi:hypothetical protein
VDKFSGEFELRAVVPLLGAVVPLRQKQRATVGFGGTYIKAPSSPPSLALLSLSSIVAELKIEGISSSTQPILLIFCVVVEETPIYHSTERKFTNSW